MADQATHVTGRRQRKNAPVTDLQAFGGYGLQAIIQHTFPSGYITTSHPIQPTQSFTILATGAIGAGPDFSDISEKLAQISRDLVSIKDSLAEHQRLLIELASAVRGAVAEIEIEEVDNHEARRRIQSLFDTSKESLYYDDIAERLSLPLRQTVEICNQLEAEGLIGEPASK